MVLHSLYQPTLFLKIAKLVQALISHCAAAFLYFMVFERCVRNDKGGGTCSPMESAMMQPTTKHCRLFSIERNNKRKGLLQEMFEATRKGEEEDTTDFLHSSLVISNEAVLLHAKQW